MKEKLPNNSHLNNAINNGVNDGTNWLNLSSAPAVHLKLFKFEIVKIFRDLKKQRPNSIASPEFYPGMLERISELIELLESN